MTAPDAVSQAIASCNTSRNEWIQAQVDYGISRYDAETVASTAESAVFPILLGLVGSLRGK